MTNLKEQLYNKFVQVAQQRVTDLELIIKEAQHAANNETKSSAGDKHETGRAMAGPFTQALSHGPTEGVGSGQGDVCKPQAIAPFYKKTSQNCATSLRAARGAVAER